MNYTPEKQHDFPVYTDMNLGNIVESAFDERGIVVEGHQIGRPDRLID